jgi:hypothetical protein
MTRVCVRHPFEHSENMCGHCGLEFCRDCLVPPAKSRKHALCVSCALAAGGVRSTASNRPAMSKRDIKKRLKERAAEDKAMARLERQAEPLPPIDNPFPPGWAIAEEEPLLTKLPPPPPPPATDRVLVEEPQPARAVADVAPIDRPPTLADLLPSMAPHGDGETAALASLPTREQELGWDGQGDPEEPDRSRRGLNLLRRREAEPDDRQDASEMIAWLDEVFAPRDQ